MIYTPEQVVGKTVIWTDWDGKKTLSKCYRYMKSELFFSIAYQVNKDAYQFALDINRFNISVERCLAEVIEVEQEEVIL